MNSSVLRVLAVMLAAGAVSVGYYGYRMSKQAPPETQHTPVQVAVPEAQPVLVAVDAIPAGHILSAEDLTVELMPTRPPYAYSTPAEIVGRQVKKDIAGGAVIVANDFPSYSQLAQTLEPGERAMAVRVDEVIGTGGFVEPGDHVDVLLYLNSDKEVGKNSSAQVLLSNVRVLAFGNQLEDEPEPQQSETNMARELSDTVKDEEQEKPTGKKSKTAVLAIDEEKTPILLLAETKGKLRLVVRGADMETTLNVGHRLESSSGLTTNIKPAGSKDEKHSVLLKELVPHKTIAKKRQSQSRPLKKVIVHRGHQTETQVLKR